MATKLEIAKTGIRLYSIWGGIQERCYSVTSKAYHRYGGRGIAVEWGSFDEFFNDMSVGHSFDKSLDRIDNNGNYSKENCRWATAKEQGNNRRSNRLLTKDGITMTLSEWSTKTGIKRSAISQRLDYYGWTVEKALTVPTATRKKRT